VDLNSDKFKYLDGYVLNNNRLIVSNLTPSDGVMYLYDISGKALMNKKIPTSVSEIPVSLETGVYILNLQADGKYETVKLIIK
ncbi:MAG TPA: T9SS type A sorting domain-containing protein, partial [Paludibacteraceae bacterium]|nr:T9SS type A sorting domain-containing protein [Paludibacteraceae bacterium]HPT44054.1 T9SS type A sorting domain-containing protein [Paludibacteraceae bacterium]